MAAIPDTTFQTENEPEYKRIRNGLTYDETGVRVYGSGYDMIGLQLRIKKSDKASYAHVALSPSEAFYIAQLLRDAAIAKGYGDASS